VVVPPRIQEYKPHVAVEEARELPSQKQSFAAQQFLERLPEEGLSVAEEMLHAALHHAIAEQTGADGTFARLSLVAQVESVREAKVALQLPKSLSLSAWIQRRLTDLAVRTGESGDTEISVIAGYGKSLRSKGKGKMRPPLPLGLPPGHSHAASEAHRGAAPDPEPEPEVSREAARQAREEAAMQALAAFWESLPEDEFTEEELNLRQALLEQLIGGQGRALRFSMVCQAEPVRQAKAALLPREVTVASWVLG